MQLNERPRARATIPENAPSAMEAYENGSATRRMSTFINNNMRAVRRLIGIPTTALGEGLSPSSLRGDDPRRRLRVGGLVDRHARHREINSRTSGRRTQSVAEELMSSMKLNRRAKAMSDGSSALGHRTPPSPGEEEEAVFPRFAMRSKTNTASSTGSNNNSTDSTAAIRATANGINLRSRGSGSRGTPSSPALSLDASLKRATSMRGRTMGQQQQQQQQQHHLQGSRTRASSSTSTLRLFRLRELVEGQGHGLGLQGGE
ncbi:hypothetical protein SODALDRAFT_351378 [Sodiomyces alkalinus F11]|uniref:Uncharacterized protein n=1 Tax=Sodiomyces alkalinus (strain CBS 110278 / VKM F-3762 / F11) TaxID=1314773 RepID=A0A3N2PUX7_SODAK|nr:hypothetical protein SODALDRAFT_351378 [Sodiomyces alkalinus F11]ROT38295.1 hypothetical protein SODALDRAFT_351378 [Sodiomyces alkalinus F11]